MSSRIHLPLQLAAAILLTTPGLARAQEVYDVDPGHSAVIFRVGHFGAGVVYGRFRTLSGEFTIDKKAAKVKIVVDAGSVYTADKKRDQHIASPDFLNAKQFPKITFESTKVHRTGKTYLVNGKLTLHGVTKPVKVKMKHLGSGKGMRGELRVGFEGSFTIKRGDYGITKMKGAVGESIRMTIAVEGVRR